jgi:Peptidase family M23
VPKLRSPQSPIQLAAALLALICSVAAKDRFTPVVVSTLTSTATPVLGTDGEQHIVYELVITNTNGTPATLNKVSVLDASDQSKVIASFQGKDLLSRLRLVLGGAAKSPNIEQSTTRLFLIDISLPADAPIPSRLTHRFDLLAGAGPASASAVALDYVAAPIDIARKLRVISPPLRGQHWVDTNGCCAPGGVHRASGLPVNGDIYFAQRFAIDWMQLDNAGRLVHGDSADVRNYTCYGADILAVADGNVIETQNDLDDQKPGTLPDPKTITIDNVDGNHVILDLGDGVYAFYAHMQKDGVAVHVGDHVKRGQVLGKLGNTGNTSAPHLHFQLMDGPSALGAQGIPYVIDAFQLAGEVNKAQFDAAPGVEGDWSKGLLPAPSPRQNQFPMDLNVVNF